MLAQSPLSNSSTLRRGSERGFTLVELLVAMTVLLVLILMMVGMTNQTNRIWRDSRARISAFQSARNAFERITANLHEATLNTYLDYYTGKNGAGKSRADLIRTQPRGLQSDEVVNFQPMSYDRASDLQFVCGSSEQGNDPLIKPTLTGSRPGHALFFQCPLGHVSDPTATSGTAITPVHDFKHLDRALNAVGYYVEFSNENDPALGLVPGFIKANNAAPTTTGASWRYRLMELNQPSQNLAIYASSPAVSYANPKAWFFTAVNPDKPPAPVYAMADNIVAIIIRPKVRNPTATASTAPAPPEISYDYSYDSKEYLKPRSHVRQNAGVSTDALTKNQLPPLVQVTLVAIDADSASRLATRFGSAVPPLVDPSLFGDVDKYDADLNTTLDPKYPNALLPTLRSYRLNYRVFVADVTVPGAKWSQTQAP